MIGQKKETALDLNKPVRFSSRL